MAQKLTATEKTMSDTLIQLTTQVVKSIFLQKTPPAVPGWTSSTRSEDRSEGVSGTGVTSWKSSDRGLFLKCLDRVGDRGKSVDPAQPRLHSLVAQPLAHRGARFHGLHPDAAGSEFVRDAP